MEDMKLIDTHCHPQFHQYDADRDHVIRRALDAGIGMICVGTDLSTSKQAIELAERYEGLYASVGLHPNDSLGEEYDQHTYTQIAQHTKVVAIGEIGLDYFRTVQPEQKEVQRQRFVQQLDLAQMLMKPTIIHCRDAHADMIELLRGENSKAGGVIHSFNGTIKEARSYTDEGFFIGLNAIITFSPSYKEMVRSLPQDRILLETDAPYLAPAPHRGRRNESLYVDILCREIAKILTITPDKLAATTLQNARSLFSM